MISPVMSPAKLRLLLGPSCSGKAAVALAAYREVLSRHGVAGRRRALWLAPTQAAASDVRDALIEGPADIFLDPGVMTFAGFANSVAWDAGVRVRTLTAVERRRLVRLVINQAHRDGRLPYFAPVVESGGLTTLVDETITALKRRDVDAAAYRRIARSRGARDQDLAELYERYQHALARAQADDAEGLFRAARDGMERTVAIGTGLELVVVDGFTDFTVAQRGIVELLAQRAAQVWITLDAEPTATRPDLFAKTSETARLLQQSCGATVDRPSKTAPDAWPAMAHLERNLFRSYRDLEPLAAPAASSLARIQIVAASGVQAEVEEIARRVKRLLLAGAAPGDVVVAFRSTRPVADRLRQAFDDFGIPVYVDAVPRLDAAPVVRRLLSAIRLHVEDWPYRLLLEVVGSGQWAVGSDGTPLTDLRRAMELCIRHAQAPAGRAALRAQFVAWLDENSEDTGAALALAAPVALAGLDQLGGMLDRLPARATLEKWIEVLEQLATDLGLIGRRATAEAGAAWRTLARGLQGVANVDAWSGESATFSAEEVLDLVADTAADLPAPEPRDATGRVRILSAEAARLTQPRHLLVGGLSEQAFPIARADATPIDDDERSDIDPGGDEMLLFYQLVTRPTETLTLSFPALDAKAQPMPASPFLVELERVFAGALVRTVQPLNYREQVDDEGQPPHSRSELRRAAVLRASTHKRELLAALAASPAEDLAHVGQSILAGVEAVASRGRREFAEFEGLLHTDAARQQMARRFDPDYLWSPSHLELYAGCPYRFFGEKVLRLAPAPEMALESDLARRGSLLHETLARLYGQLIALPAGAPPTPAEVAQRFQETLDAIVHAQPRVGLDRALREIERRQIAAWAVQFAQQHDLYATAYQDFDGPLTPTHFEVRFGPGRRRRESAEGDLSTDEPFQIAIGDELFRFTGQIDRIDVGRVGQATVFNVIDYKTAARVRVDADEIRAGRQIQLPLYVMAVAELLLKDLQAAPLAAGYWSIRGKGFALGGRSPGPLAVSEVTGGVLRAAASWPDLRQQMLTRIKEIVGAIRSGWFPVFNDDPECGRYCPLSTTCRITHVRSLEKQWAPPVLACRPGDA